MSGHYAYSDPVVDRAERYEETTASCEHASWHWEELHVGPGRVEEWTVCDDCGALGRRRGEAVEP